MTSRCVRLAAIGWLVCGTRGFAQEDRRPERPRVDLAKTAVIEVPAKLLVVQSSAVQTPPAPPLPASKGHPKVAEPAAADVGKADVELPAKEVLAGARHFPRTRPGGRPANPKVAAGKVAWHPDFASACAASGKSGKPVLHFQLLGNLDDRFC